MVTRKPLPAHSKVAPLSPTTTSQAQFPTDTDHYNIRTSDGARPVGASVPHAPRATEPEQDAGLSSDDEWGHSDPEWDADTDREDEDESNHVRRQSLPATDRQRINPIPPPVPSNQPPSLELLSRNASQDHDISPSSFSDPPGLEVATQLGDLGISKPSVSPQSNNPFLRPQNTGEAIFGAESNVSTLDQPPVTEHDSEGKILDTRGPAEELRTLSLSSHDLLVPPIKTQSSQEFPGTDQRNRENLGTAEDEKEVVGGFVGREHGVSRGSHQPPDAGLSGADSIWYEGRSTETGHEPLPPLPGRHQETSPSPPLQPPRPLIDTRSPAAEDKGKAGLNSPGTPRQRQRKENYQIKHVRWFDASSQRTRVSPILIQNLNGPCPLLALVNALVLSTPMEVTTGLVETLRTREQVSLGLLLDAVFDELVSRGHENAQTPLPDVGELYAFLLTLHTGMNVNPRFVQAASLDPLISAASHGASQPGSFEDTREMRLYSTFGVPLMHGWIPKMDSHAYSAFERSAKTYEDAQNIQFHEEELEGKIASTGLTEQEQEMFEDLITIKEFLNAWPTQLTDHGLDTVNRYLQPGSFAILFRNDHFSTIYKEPRSAQLVTLVTDAGYSSHDEIVWESLVDMNGMASEYFSGDFRPVSHNIPLSASGPIPAGPRQSSLHQQKVQSMLDVDQGWSTVQSKRGRGKQPSTDQESGILHSNNGPSNTTSSDASTAARRAAEQEDADLALALQLQEEEEDRLRQTEEARRREDQLSQQFFERNGSAPSSGPRRPSPGSTNRPLIPPRRQDENAPPPSYEQASKTRPFHPSRNHPSSPLAPTPSNSSGGSIFAGGGNMNQRRQSAYAANNAAYHGNYGAQGIMAQSPPMGRRRTLQNGVLVDQIPSGGGGSRGGRGSSVGGSAGPGALGEDREKCVIM